MVETEVGSTTVENAISLAFSAMEDQWGDSGSPWRSFYEKSATMPNRVVAWNTKRYTSRHGLCRYRRVNKLTDMRVNIKGILTRASLLPKRRHRQALGHG
jgi:hypothetical protein